ncbi:MAG: hypothetical protein AAF525_09460 [Pseudomonadota bacterium]
MKELASIAWSVVLVLVLNASPTLAENNEAPVDFPEAGSVAYDIQFRLLRGDMSGALALGRRAVAEAGPDLATLVAYLNALTTRLSWDDRYTVLDDEIIETADRILLDCEARLLRDEDDALAHHFCGSSNVSLSYLHAVRGRYLRAITTTTRAMTSHKRALELEPTLQGAKMNYGLLLYFTDNLPPFVRALGQVLWFVPRGNAEEGLALVKETALSDHVLGHGTRYPYGDILIDQENENEAGLEQIMFLVERYPSNPRFYLRAIWAVEKIGRDDDILTLVDRFRRSANIPINHCDDQGMTPLLALWRVRALARLGRTQEARDELRVVLRCPDEPSWAAATFNETRTSLGSE